MAGMLMDVRNALAIFRREPGFALISVLVLGLGIGLNTATFGVANALWLRPLPFDHPERIIELLRVLPEGSADVVSVAQLVAWQKAASFEAVAGYGLFPGGFNLETGGEPIRLAGMPVTEGFFRVLGVKPAVGRGFEPQDGRLGAAQVAVLSDQLWASRFGRDRAVLGSVLRMNHKAYTVVGVMPPQFRFPTTADLWIPLQLAPDSLDPANLFLAFGRLKPEASMTQAKLELDQIMGDVRRALPPDVSVGIGTQLVPLQEYLTGNTRVLLLIVSGAVFLVLLIACTNFANLLVGYFDERIRDLAIRSALGATTTRLASQVIACSVVLAAAGGAAGLLLAMAMRGVSGVFLDGMPLAQGWRLDSSVLLFHTGLSVLVGLLTGLVPIANVAGPNLEQALREGSDRASAGGRRVMMRRSIVVAQISLSLALMVGAGLFVQSLVQMLKVNPGFDARNVLTFQMSLPESVCSERVRREAFLTAALERLGTIPGAAAVAVVTTLPLERGPDLPFTAHRSVQGQDVDANAEFRAISPDYFKVMGIPLREGRSFSSTDTADSVPVAVVNERLARERWPGQSALDQSLTIGTVMGPGWADKGPRRIVGVVADVKELKLDEPAPEVVFVPHGQVTAPAMSSVVYCEIPTRGVVRTHVPPLSLVPAVKSQVFAVDPGQPIAEIKTMESVVADATQTHRFMTSVLGLFAMGATLLAAFGIYGVTARAVLQRRRELAIRMALGASTADVVRMVAVEGARLGAIGTGIGLVLVFVITRVSAGEVLGIHAMAPGVWAAAALLLVAVAMLASFVPARRAARIEPMDTLRVG
jgi:predicted permease